MFELKLKEIHWAILILIIVLLSFFVPYTLLTNVAKWSGSFLFWTVCTLIVIGMNYLLTRDWR